jgi:predicted small metal-binding protein
MKTMTCKDLGGTCDQKLTAGSWDEMVKAMTKHVMEKHPDVAKQMERMHKEDPKKWGSEMKPKWDAAAEVWFIIFFCLCEAAQDWAAP